MILEFNLLENKIVITLSVISTSLNDSGSQESTFGISFRITNWVRFAFNFPRVKLYKLG